MVGQPFGAEVELQEIQKTPSRWTITAKNHEEVVQPQSSTKKKQKTNLKAHNTQRTLCNQNCLKKMPELETMQQSTQMEKILWGWWLMVLIPAILNLN